MRIMIKFYILMLILILTGCTEISTAERSSYGAPAVSPNPQKEIIEVTLFFANDTMTGVIPESREVLKAETIEETIIRELFNGPTDYTLRRLWPITTNVISVETIGGITYINLSRESYNKLFNFKEAKLAIDSITYSLTELSDILGIQFLVEGKRKNLLGDQNILEPIYRRIKTGDVETSPDRLRYIQRRAVEEEEWRFDPMEVAKRKGRIAGFLPTDSFKIIEKKKPEQEEINEEKAIKQVEAINQGRSYQITLSQPLETGEDSVWVIENVEANFTEIPPIKYNEGERFVFGNIKRIDYLNRTILMERIYQDIPGDGLELNTELKVKEDAIIHIQEIIGIKEDGSFERKEVDGEFVDIKEGYEVGMILTNDKEVRASVVTPKY